MENFLIHYGLLAVALFAFFEGDITYVMAGVVAHLGYFDFMAVIIIGSICSYANDVVWYWVGYKQADKIKASRIYRRAGPKVERLAAKYGTWQILSTRLVYGTRIASAIFWGVQKFSFVRYTIIDFLSCLLWAVVLTGLGFFLSNSAGMLIRHVHALELWLLVAVIIGVGAYIVGRTALKQRVKELDQVE